MCGITTYQSVFDFPLFPKYSYALPFFVLSIHVPLPHVAPAMRLGMSCDIPFIDWSSCGMSSLSVASILFSPIYVVNIRCFLISNFSFLSFTVLTTIRRLFPSCSDRLLYFVFRSSTIRTAPAAAGMCVVTTYQSASYSLSSKCFPALLFFVAPPLLVRIRWHTCRRFFILLDSTGAGQHYRRPDEFAPMDVGG
jgi:hypothetical protein